MYRQKLKGGQILFEDLTATNTVSTLNITANGDYAEIAGFNTGDFVRITEPANLAGDYVVTNFNGTVDLGFTAVFGLTANDVNSGVNIKGYKVAMVGGCFVTQNSLDLGTWNTDEWETLCDTYKYSAGFSRGNYTFDFYEDWENNVLEALFDKYQEGDGQTNAPSVLFVLRPILSDKDNNGFLSAKVEYCKGLLTALSFDRGLSDPSTGSITAELLGKVRHVRVSENLTPLGE